MKIILIKNKSFNNTIPLILSSNLTFIFALWYNLRVRGELMRDFASIAEEIINSEKYQSLKSENHHGLSRYDHSLRVARNTYKL